MSPTVLDPAVDLEELRLRCVIDHDLRAQVLADPGAFGVDPADLPAPIEARDPGLLDLSSITGFAADCRSTCTSGIVTIICDGTTK